MTTRAGWFDPSLAKKGIFDATLDKAGIFALDFVSGELSSAFDPALMAAMSRPWPDIVFSKPQVVAAGMTPPDRLPT